MDIEYIIADFRAKLQSQGYLTEARNTLDIDTGDIIEIKIKIVDRLE